VSRTHSHVEGRLLIQDCTCTPPLEVGNPLVWLGRLFERLSEECTQRIIDRAERRAVWAEVESKAEDEPVDDVDVLVDGMLAHLETLARPQPMPVPTPGPCARVRV
jgi:hypothetical protein